MEWEVKKISKKLQEALLVFSKEEFGTGQLFFSWFRPIKFVTIDILYQVLNKTRCILSYSYEHLRNS